MEVLIVDDSVSYLKVVNLALRRRGIQATGCSDYVLALDAAHDERIGMIVSDYFMPRIDGRNLLMMMREIRPDCELILTSTYPIGMHCLVDSGITFVEKSELIKTISNWAQWHRCVDEVLV